MKKQPEEPKKKTPFDGMVVKPPTEAQMKKIIKEIEENQRRRQEGPPPPGDREIALGLRAKTLKKKCAVCKAPLEQLYSIEWPNNDIIGPGGRGRWVPDGCRCTKCKLAYDMR